MLCVHIELLFFDWRRKEAIFFMVPMEWYTVHTVFTITTLKCDNINSSTL